MCLVSFPGTRHRLCVKLHLFFISLDVLCLCIRSGKCPTIKTASLEPTCLCSHVQRVTFPVKRLGQCNAQVEGMASPQDELLHRKLTGVVLLIVGFNLEVHCHKDCAASNLFLGDPRWGWTPLLYSLPTSLCTFTMVLHSHQPILQALVMSLQYHYIHTYSFIYFINFHSKTEIGMLHSFITNRLTAVQCQWVDRSVPVPRLLQQWPAALQPCWFWRVTLTELRSGELAGQFSGNRNTVVLKPGTCRLYVQ